MDDAFLAQVKEKGAYLRQAIEAMELPCLGKTRGLGMMIGIDVVGEQTNSQLAAKLIESGLLILTAGPGLRLLPPLDHHPGGDGQGAVHYESGAVMIEWREKSEGWRDTPSSRLPPAKIGDLI